MKAVLHLGLFLVYFSVQVVFSQMPKPGKYQSDDGMASFSIAILPEGIIELTEPSLTSQYMKDGDLYRNNNPEYSNYLIRVESENEIFSLKDNSTVTYKFTWIGSEVIESEDCLLYHKYQDLASDDNEVEVQAYTFCSAAALAKCNYTSQGFQSYLLGIVMTLKQIIVDPDKCPCLDVIPQNVWDDN